MLEFLVQPVTLPTVVPLWIAFLIILSIFGGLMFILGAPNHNHPYIKEDKDV